jgi:hypothetical protein
MRQNLPLRLQRWCAGLPLLSFAAQAVLQLPMPTPEVANDRKDSWSRAFEAPRSAYGEDVVVHGQRDWHGAPCPDLK